jgi:hypothetical protein
VASFLTAACHLDRDRWALDRRQRNAMFGRFPGSRDMFQLFVMSGFLQFINELFGSIATNEFSNSGWTRRI